ncbi:hypothetical protein EUTSA_v10021230mg [Eutrema salsugineum]|uniref:RING-type E3 ubiquitin transferase n=1 Tax=Eutrema salsugineum TaxID=72664 RepID=V4NQ36_EUTSA|nr:hypothetical protein EUTSA_v10021230mg [Eutrema salsugineum]
MEAASETRYWCHMCERSVNPEIEGEIINCNLCQGGFVEEMDNAQDSVTNENDDHHQAADSLWAPILIGMMNNHDHHTRNQSDTLEDEDDDDDNDEQNNDGEVDLDQQLDEIMRRRRSHSAAILDLLQGIRAGLSVVSESNEDNSDNELVVLINSFNQRMRIQESDNDANSVPPSGSLGDYFIGPGFETLLEPVESLATVKIDESLLQCTVCLDDFEIGMVAKEMPCKHRFHSDCLLPWLELHSSCPVCRCLLPATGHDDEPKTDAETSRNDGNNVDTSVASTESSGTSLESGSNNSSAS